MKNLVLISFVILALIQWIVPGSMIWKKERILDRGEAFKFETAPVDPSNPFMGKFIYLNFKEAYSKFPVHEDYISGEKIFVSYKKDPKGFATISGISKKRPATTGYLETTVSYLNREKNSRILFFSLPFNRLYMDEYKAPRAETVYGERSRDTTAHTYALVSMYKGDAIIKDVFINDTSIREFININKDTSE